jgi:peptide/nickel transport system substrate-binding protein
MKRDRRILAAAPLSALCMLTAMLTAGPAAAQKHGGILRLSHFDSPASMSILEESTRATLQPMMGSSTTLSSISWRMEDLRLGK